MRRRIAAVALVLVALVACALGVDAVVGLFQPVLEAGAGEGILRTFDDDAGVQENRLVVLDDGGVLWIQSNHHFRGWYHRLLRNPDVELVREGEVRAYRAVPVDTPETEARMQTLLKRRVGTLPYYLIRSVLLFADTKPVRLDPR